MISREETKIRLEESSQTGSGRFLVRGAACFDFAWTASDAPAYLEIRKQTKKSSYETGPSIGTDQESLATLAPRRWEITGHCPRRRRLNAPVMLGDCRCRCLAIVGFALEQLPLEGELEEEDRVRRWRSSRAFTRSNSRRRGGA
jgi:hypothetical protein